MTLRGPADADQVAAPAIHAAVEPQAGEDAGCPSPAEHATCGLLWSDGWAPDHFCGLLEGHDGPHRCHCDSYMGGTR